MRCWLNKESKNKADVRKAHQDERDANGPDECPGSCCTTDQLHHMRQRLRRANWNFPAFVNPEDRDHQQRYRLNVGKDVTVERQDQHSDKLPGDFARSHSFRYSFQKFKNTQHTVRHFGNTVLVSPGLVKPLQPALAPALALTGLSSALQGKALHRKHHGPHCQSALAWWRTGRAVFLQRFMCHVKIAFQERVVVLGDHISVPKLSADRKVQRETERTERHVSTTEAQGCHASQLVSGRNVTPNSGRHGRIIHVPECKLRGLPHGAEFAICTS
mmetsp:Transcript_50570/g.134571  ORF Transcript_50570/g.134571 Transcript_50570/m.134571 type:complete len:273 (+) Transcript_50570:403-1221(+)